MFNALHWGEDGVKKNYALQIGKIVQAARKKLGDVPVVFGECGVPMDLKSGPSNHEGDSADEDPSNEEAFSTGDFKWQERMMDAMISALEASSVGFK